MSMTANSGTLMTLAACCMLSLGGACVSGEEAGVAIKSTNVLKQRNLNIESERYEMLLLKDNKIIGKEKEKGIGSILVSRDKKEAVIPVQWHVHTVEVEFMRSGKRQKQTVSQLQILSQEPKPDSWSFWLPEVAHFVRIFGEKKSKFFATYLVLEGVVIQQLEIKENENSQNTLEALLSKKGTLREVFSPLWFMDEKNFETNNAIVRNIFVTEVAERDGMLLVVLHGNDKNASFTFEKRADEWVWIKPDGSIGNILERYKTSLSSDKTEKGE
jgi:hypothetical protein